jgi:hypothetical protein
MPSKPTDRQLNYLRSLANRTGQTFAWPKTFEQASAEIDRLKQARRSSPTEVRIERKLIADAIATGPADSARVRDDEIAGRGSSATWVQNRDQQPPPPPAPRSRAKSPAAGPKVGKRTELARYTTPAGERILYGQRINGVVRFLPGERDVLVASLGPTEDDTCRSREAVVLKVESTNGARHRPLNRGGAMLEPGIEEGS